jgi:hypothetical protein
MLQPGLLVIEAHAGLRQSHHFQVVLALKFHVTVAAIRLVVSPLLHVLIGCCLG